MQHGPRTMRGSSSRQPRGFSCVSVSFAQHPRLKPLSGLVLPAQRRSVHAPPPRSPHVRLLAALPTRHSILHLRTRHHPRRLLPLHDGRHGPRHGRAVGGCRRGRRARRRAHVVVGRVRWRGRERTVGERGESSIVDEEVLWGRAGRASCGKGCGGGWRRPADGGGACHSAAIESEWFGACHIFRLSVGFWAKAGNMSVLAWV